MITNDQIAEAQKKIAAEIRTQLEHGAQSKDIKQKGALACGQFFGADAANRPQRGLHGTSAALRVIAGSDIPERNILVSQIIQFLKERDSLASPASANTTASSSAKGSDNTNIIKLSEELIALSCVKLSDCDTSLLRQEIKTKLLNAYREGKGWTHFVNQNEPVKELPTAFAVLALCRAGYDSGYEGAIQYLSKHTLTPATSDRLKPNDFSVRIFCLYALAIRHDLFSKEDEEEKKALVDCLDREWALTENLFTQDIEQNVEYWEGAAHFFVRIPWQLYLLSLTARLRPRRLYTAKMQTKIASLLADVNGEGFHYPHSGIALSTRTNAILYETLQALRECSKDYFATAYLAYDKIRGVLGSTLVRRISLTFFLLALGYILVSILKGKTREALLDSIGTDTLSALVIVILTSIMGMLRRSS